MATRFNSCVFNHPCPIFCPFSLDCTQNEVVNPTIQNFFAFYRNTNVGEIASQSILPLSFSEGSQSAVSGAGSGAVTLLAGDYQVSYFAEGTVPAGQMSIKLRLNGADLDGTAISSLAQSGNIETLTQTILIKTQQLSTLELVNNSQSSVNFLTASIYIQRL